MSYNTSDSLPSILRTWAALGTELLATHPSGIPKWEPVTRMINAASGKLAENAVRLRYVLTESRKMLAPLQDPFDVDLGLHRWLDAEREEAYSDWLEWVVRQAKSAKQIFRVFNLQNPPSDDAVPLKEITIQRECRISHGHINQEGRLDLVIRFSDKAIIVVEVKKADADGSDTIKHRGYKQWLKKQRFPDETKHSILIAPDGEQETYEGFSLVSWKSVCLGMRRLAVESRQEGRMMTAAMILAFVAAVEQNLLGFSAALVRDVCNDRPRLVNAAIVDHLAQFIIESEK